MIPVKRINCPDCDGTGKSVEEGKNDEKCQTCNGVGTVTAIEQPQ